MSMADIIMQGTQAGLASRSRGISELGSGIAGGMMALTKREDEADEKAERVKLLKLRSSKLTMENSAAQKKIAEDDSYNNILNMNLDIVGTTEALKKAKLSHRVDGYMTAKNDMIQQEADTTAKQANMLRQKFDHLAELSSAGMVPNATPKQQDQAWAAVVAADKQMNPDNDLNKGMEGMSSGEKLTKVSKMGKVAQAQMNMGLKQRNKNIGDKMSQLEIHINGLDKNDPTRASKIEAHKRMKTTYNYQNQKMREEIDMKRLNMGGKEMARGMARGLQAFNIAGTEPAGDTADMAFDTEKLYAAGMGVEDVKAAVQSLYELDDGVREGGITGTTWFTGQEEPSIKKLKGVSVDDLISKWKNPTKQDKFPVGFEKDGHRFKGGDWKDQKNWTKIEDNTNKTKEAHEKLLKLDADIKRQKALIKNVESGGNIGAS